MTPCYYCGRLFPGGDDNPPASSQHEPECPKYVKLCPHGKTYEDCCWKGLKEGQVIGPREGHGGKFYGKCIPGCRACERARIWE